MKRRQSLTKEADRVFSLYVRNRGSTYGYNHCFTCGAYLPVEELQAGHFINRRFVKVRWHPVNVWPQCNYCNVEMGGNIEIYEYKLRSMYGHDAIDGLFILANSDIKITEDNISEIIKQYK